MDIRRKTISYTEICSESVLGNNIHVVIVLTEMSADIQITKYGPKTYIHVQLYSADVLNKGTDGFCLSRINHIPYKWHHC
jgi:hypothetical protein